MVSMGDQIAGFDWDEGNREKCQKHGVSIAEIEALFLKADPFIGEDVEHSEHEDRFFAVGNAPTFRMIFVIFTFRQRDGLNIIRPVSARYMHRKEIERYAKKIPRFENR
jgi:uncharacterized protein